MTRVNINSVSGTLEGIFKASEYNNAPCVLLLHPHPLYGGNMHSKVISTLEKAFYKNGFSTLKFNFRGVGESEGEYGDAVEEIIDASTCCDWLQKKEGINPQHFWVAGFSFGAYIAIQIMMRRIEVSRFMAVGLPVKMFDVSFIYPCPVNGLFVHAEKDMIAPLKHTEPIIKKTMRTEGKSIEYEIIKNADHFFNNHMEDFYKCADSYIQKGMKEDNIILTK